MRFADIEGIEVFKMDRSDFVNPDKDSWMADSVAANDGRSAGLAGWYWWSCLPGCLPDGDPSGPFKSPAAARRDAVESLDG